MTHRRLDIYTENDIPDDVLVEHVAVAMQDLKFTGKVDVKLHPFDKEEVFDDSPQLEKFTGTVREGGFLPPDPYPLTTRVIDAIKQTRRDG